MKFANPDATDQEIEQALRDSNAWDFVRTMEKGLDTVVGGSGGSLSGGQKQRVAIARAFIKQPRILLLDEATSALDSVNEKIVQDAIDKYRKEKGNITTIVIAHRLSTIRDADKIVVIVNGKLTEMGNHDELQRDYPNGTYVDFCNKQQNHEQAKAQEPEEQADTGEESEIKKSKTIIDSDPVNQRKLKEAEDMDLEEEEKIKKILEESKKKKGSFGRLMEM
jgi:ABC-type transport system involved in cytochrome bd biosynthesis fused ATPase/permease subunit